MSEKEWNTPGMQLKLLYVEANDGHMMSKDYSKLCRKSHKLEK